jgi:hypothetical protein
MAFRAGQMLGGRFQSLGGSRDATLKYLNEGADETAGPIHWTLVAVCGACGVATVT